MLLEEVSLLTVLEVTWKDAVIKTLRQKGSGDHLLDACDVPVSHLMLIATLRERELYLPGEKLR